MSLKILVLYITALPRNGVIARDWFLPELGTAAGAVAVTHMCAHKGLRIAPGGPGHRTFLREARPAVEAFSSGALSSG